VFDIDFLKGLRLCVVFELPLLRNAPKNPRKESIGWGSKTKTRTCLSGVSHQVDSKNTKRKLFETKSMSKMFYKKMRKIPFRFFCHSFLLRFWKFFCTGSLKTPKSYLSKNSPKISHKKSTHPPPAVGAFFLFLVFSAP
jgi:hypothetical protein